MVSKKLKRSILSAFAMGCLLPSSFHVQAAELNTESQEIDVESRESNEEFLNYLELVDNFVTAERIPTNKWETPANVTVITSQEIEDNHYQTVAEALSHVNGLVVVNGGANSAGRVMLNGDYRILLLIDGHRANNNQTSYQSDKSDLSMIPSIKMVERIEVVKGGYSALYGSDAVGGVINIITKKGVTDETTVDLNTGYWNQHNYEFTNQGVKGKLSWFVTGGFGKSRAYEYNGAASTSALYTQTDYEDRDFSIRLDDQFDDNNSLTVNYLHRTHDYAINYTNGLAYGLYNSASIEYHFKEDSDIPGWLRYYNNYQKGYLLGKAKLQGAEYQNGWEFGDHKLIVGAEYNRVEAENAIDGYSNHRVNNQALYLQDTYSLTNKWTLIPGLRYDHNGTYGSHWSPKLATNYRADDQTKIYASWGKVYRTPTVAEIYMVDETAHYYGNQYYLEHEGDYALDAETGHTEMIGIEHNFNDRTNITANFFNSRLNNAIRWQGFLTPYIDDNGNYVQDVLSYIPTNRMNEKRRGFELTFQQSLDIHFTYDIGYSHTSLSDVNTLAGVTSDVYSQPNGYRLGLRYKNKEWKANLLGIMASGLDESVFASGKYAVLDFNTSYDMNDHATVYFRALNFTNQDYSNISANYPSPGRFVQAGVNFRF